METGAEAAEGSLWERGGKKEGGRKDRGLASAEESVSGVLTEKDAGLTGRFIHACKNTAGC